jgi:hypothetical protein
LECFIQRFQQETKRRKGRKEKQRKLPTQRKRKEGKEEKFMIMISNNKTKKPLETLFFNLMRQM